MFLEEFCKLRNKALICISHDRKFLGTFNKVIEITNHQLQVYYCGYEDFLLEKKKKSELQLKHFTAQQKYLEQQERFIERFRFKASKASQVQSRIKLLDKMEKIEPPEAESMAQPPNFQVKWRLPEILMKFSELSIGYDGKILVDLPAQLEVSKAMKIGIIGRNGV